jgi:hypothetical protein
MSAYSKGIGLDKRRIVRESEDIIFALNNTKSHMQGH